MIPSFFKFCFWEPEQPRKWSLSLLWNHHVKSAMPPLPRLLLTHVMRHSQTEGTFFAKGKWVFRWAQDCSPFTIVPWKTLQPHSLTNHICSRIYELWSPRQQILSSSEEDVWQSHRSIRSQRFSCIEHDAKNGARSMFPVSRYCCFSSTGWKVMLTWEFWMGRTLYSMCLCSSKSIPRLRVNTRSPNERTSRSEYCHPIR